VDRIKALIVGGDERNINDEVERVVEIVKHITQKKTSVSTQAGMGAQVVIVITKAISQSAIKDARKIAQQRGIPLIFANNAIYIIEGLKKCADQRIQRYMSTLAKQETPKCKVSAPSPTPVLTNGASEPVTHEAEPIAAQSVETKPEEVETTGLSREELMEHYGDRVLASLKDVLSPGDKIHEDDLFDLLRPDYGFPQKDMIAILDEFALQGLLCNTAGKTWMLPDPDNYERVIEDREEVKSVAEEMKEKETARARKPVEFIKLITIISGLPEGPYKMKRDIVRMAMRCPEFRTKKGEELNMGYGDLLVKKAIGLGVIEELPDGQWKVNHDSKVEITLIEETPQKNVAAAPVVQAPERAPDDLRRKTSEEHRSDRFEELLRKQMGKVGGVESVAAEAPKKARATVAEAVRKSFGSVIPVIGPWLPLIKKDRPRLPHLVWDEAACQTIAKQLRTSPHACNQYMAFKNEFDDEEWDVLAWQFLRVMPHEEIVKMYLERHDLTLTCGDCLGKFVFSTGEQIEYEKRFGEVTPPKRCLKCRKADRGEPRL